MMKIIPLSLSFLIIPLFSMNPLHGEMIYLKDGQVIRGSIINEDSETVTVKNKFQTRRVYRTYIMRILYGERDMEQVFILLKNGTQLKGYLVDQDSANIVFRETRESAEEKNISKEIIRQISGEEITLLSPDIACSMGLFLPTHGIYGGGARLKSAPIYFMSSGFNFMNIKDTRILFEAGYTRSENISARGSFFQFIPLTVNAVYSIELKYAGIMPKIGLGTALIKFNNGEGDKYQGINMDIVAGIGINYCIIKPGLNANLWIEYNLISEGTALMGNAVLRAGLSYLF